MWCVVICSVSTGEGYCCDEKLTIAALNHWQLDAMTESVSGVENNRGTNRSSHNQRKWAWSAAVLSTPASEQALDAPVGLIFQGIGGVRDLWPVCLQEIDHEAGGRTGKDSII